MDQNRKPAEEIEGVEMLPIATEVLTVTEQNPGSYASVLNDGFFAERQIRDPNRYLKAMFLLARDKLIREISTADRARTVETAVHRSFRSTVFSASFLLDDEMNLVFLTYFGEKTPSETNYSEALVHVLEVLDILEHSLGEEASGAGQKLRPKSVSTRAQRKSQLR